MQPESEQQGAGARMDPRGFVTVLVPWIGTKVTLDQGSPRPILSFCGSENPGPEKTMFPLAQEGRGKEFLSGSGGTCRSFFPLRSQAIPPGSPDF
jgi:hypothetical protein